MATPSTGGTKYSDNPPAGLPTDQSRLLNNSPSSTIDGDSLLKKNNQVKSNEDNPVPKVAAWKSFISGGFGGICAVLVGQPFDLTKTRLQTAQPGQYASTTELVKKTFQKDGILGFYRGMSSPLVGVTPIFAVSFWGYAMGKKIIYSLTPSRTSKDLNYTEYAVAGAFSALPTTLIAAPIERIKVLLQVDGQSTGTPKYKGSVDCVKQVYNQGGVKSLFKGSFATVLRDSPGSAAYFVAYEVAKKKLTPKGSDPSKLNLTTICAAGGFAGIAMWSIAIPPDVIKSRLQSAPEGTYSGFLDCTKKTVKVDGLRALFKGFGPAILRAVPANAATFLGVELALVGLNKLSHPNLLIKLSGKM
ncbi:mitochondrial carnitine/acylcarnitine carrier protein [Phakopsora pachyrhizi]|uniref:Mitochondrial carnitine/acylcarnitine carrier protein n=1 Tax=Phakopsora pachyrhizi TaxID=170000 RepID=A0AAV0BLE9_PHAPC|nr:mitochondrial carnitine/acylcarnitine carrier protein [Phakopsora pachyrhizi]CAH7686800.1 mitochondrial carnitine/acylcarnitine carrier protein [Phakopsora pachyrhizi]